MYKMYKSSRKYIDQWGLLFYGTDMKSHLFTVEYPKWNCSRDSLSTVLEIETCLNQVMVRYLAAIALLRYKQQAWF